MSTGGGNEGTPRRRLAWRRRSATSCRCRCRSSSRPRPDDHDPAPRPRRTAAPGHAGRETSRRRPGGPAAGTMPPGTGTTPPPTTWPDGAPARRPGTTAHPGRDDPSPVAPAPAGGNHRRRGRKGRRHPDGRHFRTGRWSAPSTCNSTPKPTTKCSAPTRGFMLRAQEPGGPRLDDPAALLRPRPGADRLRRARRASSRAAPSNRGVNPDQRPALPPRPAPELLRGAAALPGRRVPRVEARAEPGLGRGARTSRSASRVLLPVLAHRLPGLSPPVVAYPGMPEGPFGATHFVGIAGLGHGRRRVPRGRRRRRPRSSASSATTASRRRATSRTASTRPSP